MSKELQREDIEVKREDVDAAINGAVAFICRLTEYGSQLHPSDITHCFHRVLSVERQRLRQWAEHNCWTEDDMISDLPENHIWLIDHFELLDELSNLK